MAGLINVCKANNSLNLQIIISQQAWDRSAGVCIPACVRICLCGPRISREEVDNVKREEIG